MTRGPKRRHGPALVVLALVGAAAVVVWLARPDDDRRAPARSAPRVERAGQSTPVVELTPPTSPTSPMAATETVAVPRPGAEVDTPLVDADRSQTATSELDPPPSIRGVRGLVRDGRTGAPIARAWITWREPPSDAQVDEVLRDVRPDDVATGMITGTDGRFNVDRLPDHETVTSSLFAVAAGYSSACLRPGLRGEVVFDLLPMGSLEVRVSGLPPPAAPPSSSDPPRPAREPPWVSVEPVPADPTRPTAVARIDEQSGVGHASHLAPGRWSVQFMNGAPVVVEVTAGRTTVVEVAVPAIVSVGGVISGTGSGRLSLTGVDDPDSSVEFVLTDGHFSGELRAGRYRAALLLDEDGDGEADTERNLTDTVEVRSGATNLQLHGPPRGERVQVTLTRAGQGYTTEGLGLVALDGPLLGSLIYLFPGPIGSGVHRAEAPAGRYALFEHTLLLTGELALPAASDLVFATDSFGAPVRFALPSTLHREEALRGRASLIPRALSGELARRFLHATEYKLRLTQDDPRVTFEIVAAGQYLLTGETDLGPFEAWVDLAPGVEVTVPLGE